jgi:hypothetical protein
MSKVAASLNTKNHTVGASPGVQATVNVASGGKTSIVGRSGVSGAAKRNLISAGFGIASVVAGIYVDFFKQISPYYVVTPSVLAILTIACIYLYLTKKVLPRSSLLWFGAIFVLQALAIFILAFSNYGLVDKSIRVGLEPPDTNPFLAYPQFAPTGKMGDIGDINIVQSAGVVRIEYVPSGQGPREDYFKYDNDANGSRVLNSQPANWAGVMFLYPPNNSGDVKDGGIDLRKFRKAVSFEARRVSSAANVEFVIGGVVWRWVGMERVASPYPDTMPRISFGLMELKEDWTKYSFDLSAYPEDYFRAMINGFSAVLSQSNNQIETDENGNVKPIVIELRNIRYER